MLQNNKSEISTDALYFDPEDSATYRFFCSSSYRRVLSHPLLPVQAERPKDRAEIEPGPKV